MTFDDAPRYDPAGLRLRTRARLGGLTIALATVLPYEVVAGSPQFLWDLVGELNPAGLVAYLSPAIAGLVIILGGFVVRRASSLAFLVLGALGAAAVAVSLGAEASAWDGLRLPENISHPTLPLAVLALTAAGAGLTFAEHSRRLGRVLLAIAVCGALVFSLWPARGEAPFSAVLRMLSRWGEVPDWRFQLGFVLIAILTLWPALVALLGLIHLFTPASDDQPLVSIVARYGLGVLMAMFIFRGLPQSAEGWGTFHALGAVVFITGVVTVLAAAVEVAAAALFAPPPDMGAEPGWRPRRAGAVMAAALLVVGVGLWLLARPPAKGVHWTPVAATPKGDALFGETLMAWNRARLIWDRQARGASGAEALLRVKRTGRALVEAAAALDPALEPAFTALTRGSRDLGLAGRRWYRLIGDVNGAIRASGLPYYLDPTVITFHGDPPTRHFRMRSYRVIKVRRFDVEGDAYATLHVDRLDGDSGASALLGLSRDLQPFAVVLRAELRDFISDLRGGVSSKPPTCADGDGGLADRICAGMLEAAVAEVGPRLDEAAAAVTDRHELQHQIDGPALPMAELVTRRLAGRGEAVRERVNRELSGYIAQLTAPDAPPRLGLVPIARLAIGATRARRVYPATALLVLEALTGHRCLGAHGADQAEVAQALSLLASLDGAALRLRAAEAWSDLFGEALPRVEVRESVTPAG